MGLLGLSDQGQMEWSGAISALVGADAVDMGRDTEFRSDLRLSV